MNHRASSSALVALITGLSTAALFAGRTGYAAPTAKPAARAIIKTVALDNITDWNTFIQEFRRAVARRDRSALRQIMPKTFLFSLEDEFEGDARDAAFRKWDNPHVRGWQALDRILAKGYCADPEVPGLMVSPPQ